jgi:hypothetical protein
VYAGEADTPALPANAPEARQPLDVLTASVPFIVCGLWQSAQAEWRLSTPANSSTRPLMWLDGLVAGCE